MNIRTFAGQVQPFVCLIEQNSKEGLAGISSAIANGGGSVPLNVLLVKRECAKTFGGEM